MQKVSTLKFVTLYENPQHFSLFLKNLEKNQFGIFKKWLKTQYSTHVTSLSQNNTYDCPVYRIPLTLKFIIRLNFCSVLSMICIELTLHFLPHPILNLHTQWATIRFFWVVSRIEMLTGDLWRKNFVTWVSFNYFPFSGFQPFFLTLVSVIRRVIKYSGIQKVF